MTKATLNQLNFGTHALLEKSQIVSRYSTFRKIQNCEIEFLSKKEKKF